MQEHFQKLSVVSGIRCIAFTLALPVLIAGCGRNEPPAPTSTLPQQQAAAPGQPATPADNAAPVEVETTVLDATADTWTPEEMEFLLAPIALYPDAVFSQVVVASTNPQEVLDAGNWLLENDSLQGEALDESAQQVGFTLPIRALIQFPQVIDMMCQDLDWTSELGQAYVNDQAGVLDATQRLRLQAQDVGNLESSDQMKVETVTQENQQVVTISPPETQVVYVPQYDPVAVYAPQPATTSTSTTVVQQDSGYTGGEMITTGLLAFGAGMLVNEIFDDDDDNYYYGGGYWGRPPPYYPPYPYRPRYGNGFYPSHGYDRPGGRFNNNNVIINQNNNYWNNRKVGNDRSPISAARKNRPELNALNTQAAKGPKRRAPSQGPDYEGQRTGSRDGSAVRPKVQGSYAGAGATKGKLASAKPGDIGTQQNAKPKLKGSYEGAKPSARPKLSGSTDRGRSPSLANAKARPSSSQISKPASQSRPKASANKGSGSRSSALSGINSGGADRAASDRGRKSMQNKRPSKGGGGKGKLRR